MTISIINIPEPLLGRYLVTVAALPEISDLEMEELLGRVASGDAASKRKVIESHLGWVVGCVSPNRGAGVSFSQLVQAGNLGLIRAVNRYGGTDSGAFRDFAAMWINTEVAKKTAGVRGLQ